MRIVCLQTILMKYHTLFFSKIGKISKKLSSATVVIGALRDNTLYSNGLFHTDKSKMDGFVHYTF